ncbi:nitroreductase family protein [Gilvimarinus algae]|uniref:Nitroreductase family protein n=1 Tax=Gilvimarinus algae TaxID=3058037 RepID=A0ABT8TDG8_9GAMM|nr:nitroreductase family protein [Gilvimarinus sp. SDUM040014]MDO3382144.1 nitroreductase family protein [Gilvimarinus sp. SDUM040014]
MNTLDAIYARRSAKHFDPHYPIPAAHEQQLLDATVQSPSCYNLQHWRLVVLRDPALRKTIRDTYGYQQTQITDASLLILFTADTKAWQKQPERYFANTPEGIREQLVGMIAPYFEGRPWIERDEAHRSVGLAAQTLMLAAEAMGYQSCPMMGYDLDGVAQLINLPEGFVMGPMVAIGKATEAPWPKPGQLPLKEIVRENTFA